MKKKIELAENTISKKELKSLSLWLLKYQKLTKSKLTIKFEKQFSKYLGVKYSVFVNSGSSANLLIAQSLLEGCFLRNKKIILPSVSWITTISPFIQLGYEVILCDTDKDNLGLDLNNLKSLIMKHKPSAICLCHVLGHANHMIEIIKLCKKYKILMLEDTCESLGTEFNKKKLGTFGLASSFSFYYGHHISTIEGGMVSTNNKKLYNILVSIRSHGWLRDNENNFQNNLYRKYKIKNFSKLYSFFYSGFNIRSTDLNAFLGINQLRLIDKIVKKRENNFYYYKKNLSQFWSQSSKFQKISSFAFGTIVQNRNEVFEKLKKNKIESRPLICGSIGRQPFWIKKYGITKLKNADIIHENGIYLPNHFNLKRTEIEFITDVFKSVAIPKFFE